MQQFKEHTVIQNGINKDSLRAICKLASSQKDTMLSKYIACAASGREAKKAKKDFENYIDVEGLKRVWTDILLQKSKPILIGCIHSKPEGTKL